MHSGLCKQYVKSLGLSASGFDFLFRAPPRALWQEIPLEAVLFPNSDIIFQQFRDYMNMQGSVWLYQIYY